MSDDAGSGLSRRQLLAAGGTGLLAGGTPEQVHLTWGEDPARTVVVSWATPGQAVAPRVRIGQRIIAATPRGYTDGLNGEVTWTYHARVDGLRPGATYGYAVTADNDRYAADPFSATFSTAPEGRAAFRFTSFGDLATPNPRWESPYGQAAYAVGAVETFQPLFHLLNGDLAYADLNPAAQPRAWRDFGNNIAASAAYRPWMPVPGNHEHELGHGEQELDSYLARYTLPSNGLPAFEGRWYSFRIGTVAFVCLSGDDVAYQDAGALVPSPAAPGASRYVRGYSGGAQTRWLEATLATARQDASIDWIVVQLHQCACSSARAGNGSDLGVRREWLPLFDRYEVDLVLCGHDHGYERSFPVRGVEPAAGLAADTRQPHPVTTVDSGVFDTSQGTVHLVLGCGGSGARRPVPAQAGPPGSWLRPDADADAAAAASWSARRDSATGYGIAVFDVSPGTGAGGQTSITVRYYHAVGADQASSAEGTPTGDYTLFETITLVRPRSDGRRWHARLVTHGAEIVAGRAKQRFVPPDCFPDCRSDQLLWAQVGLRIIRGYARCTMAAVVEAAMAAAADLAAAATMISAAGTTAGIPVAAIPAAAASSARAVIITGTRTGRATGRTRPTPTSPTATAGTPCAGVSPPTGFSVRRSGCW